MHVQLREEGEVDEAGAVHAFGAEAAIAVGDALPVFFLGEEAVEKEVVGGEKFGGGVVVFWGLGLGFLDGGCGFCGAGGQRDAEEHRCGESC